jgi:DNA-binding XRE family transcriptional regulator
MNFFEMKWRLAACRVQAGYTQKEAAKVVGVTEQTLISWEKGVSAPKMPHAQKLSELYQIPLAYMDWSKEGNATPLRERVPALGGA